MNVTRTVKMYYLHILRKKIRKKFYMAMKFQIWNQYQYLGNCPPTPPLNEQQSIDNNLGLMLS